MRQRLPDDPGVSRSGSASRTCGPYVAVPIPAALLKSVGPLPIMNVARHAQTAACTGGNDAGLPASSDAEPAGR
jgi:hypothetical protein